MKKIINLILPMFIVSVGFFTYANQVSVNKNVKAQIEEELDPPTSGTCDYSKGNICKIGSFEKADYKIR